MAAGLSSAITNPLESALMQAVQASDVLLGKDPECRGWINVYGGGGGTPRGRRTGRRRRGRR